MLVLSRECDTAIQIGPNVKIKVLSIQKQRVKLGVEAPSHVRVLRAEIAEGQRGAQQPAIDSNRDPFPILVVEDDRSHALLIRTALSDCFLFDVQVVSTGEAALKILEGGPQDAAAPRLIFLDYHLPDISGLEVLQRIRALPHFRTTPVLMLSGEQRESVVASCLEAGANAFVPKSLHVEDLRRSVARSAVFWSTECRLPRAGAVQSA